MMAGARAVRVGVSLLPPLLLLLLLDAGSCGRLQRATTTAVAPCEENIVLDDLLTKYEDRQCDQANEPCILDFYNYQVNNGSSTNFTCVVRASPYPRADEISLEPSEDAPVSNRSEFREWSDAGMTAVVFLVNSVRSDRQYTCRFSRADATPGSPQAGEGGIKKTLLPKLYVQPQLTSAPTVQPGAGIPNAHYVMWRPWNASLDVGSGPIERYILCIKNLSDSWHFCDSLAGSSWQSWVSTPLQPLLAGPTYQLYVHTVRPCSMGAGLPSPYTDYIMPCRAPSKGLKLSIRSVVYSHHDASIIVTWELPAATEFCDQPTNVTVTLQTPRGTSETKTMPASDLNVTFSARPNMNYTVEAFFYNVHMIKSPVVSMPVLTDPPIPQPPSMHRIYVCDSVTALAEWRYGGDFPDTILRYQVSYRRTSDQSTDPFSHGCTLERPFSQSHLECKITSLIPKTKYLFVVRAESSTGSSNNSGTLEVHFFQSVSQNVQNLTNMSRTDRSVELRWQPPTCTGGTPLKHYVVTCSSKKVGLSPLLVDANAVFVNVSGMSAETEYTCTVQPVNEAQASGSKQADTDPNCRQCTVTVWTLAARPKLPKEEPEVDRVTATSVSLRLPPTERSRLWRAVVVRLDKSHDTGNGAASSTDASQMSDDTLDRCLQYQRKSGRSGADAEDDGGWSVDSVPTSCYTAAVLDASGDASMVLDIGNNKTIGGFYNPPLETGRRYAVFVGTGVVGDGVPVFSYSLLRELVVATPKPEAIHVDHAPDTGAIVGAVFAAVVLAAVALVLLLMYMRKKRHPWFAFTRTPTNEKDKDLKDNGPLLNGVDSGDATGNSGEDLSLQPNGEPVYDNVELKRYPVLLTELADYVEQKKKDNSLKKEYMLIPWGLMARCDTAKQPENKQRNRYGNIIAYDHSRVLLVCDGVEVTSDYINANYVNGYNATKAYIATQGPMRNTIKDFWHMVWHEHAPAVVMLTNIIEQGKSKCDKYWPDEDETISGHGGLTVSLEHTRSWAGYDAHYLTLAKGGEQRQVVHFHFKDWPDHGVPTQATALLAFLGAVRNSCKGSPGPLINHCSAGVGRTGTYIALDMLLQQAEAEGKVDVYGSVLEMRKQRCNMIQTLEQYIFLHEAILEAALVGSVRMTLTEYVEKYDRILSENAPEKPAAPSEDGAAASGEAEQIDYFEKEFETLKLVASCKPEPRALQPVNSRRNRDVSVVPGEGTYVPLLTPGPGASDYINACFVDGYVKKSALISTQTPLPDTVGHFWKMVYDRRVSTVVMLNKSSSEDEDEEQQFTVYWPTSTECVAEYAQVSVKLLSEAHFGEAQSLPVKVRKFEVIARYEQSNRTSAAPQTVTQYACDFWPEDCDIPATHDVFLDLLLTIFRSYNASAASGPLVVHCLDGAMQTGLYLACHILMEQATVDGAIDVLQVVKLIRRCRPQFICSAEQLKYCHKVVLDLIKSKGVTQQIGCAADCT